MFLYATVLAIMHNRRDALGVPVVIDEVICLVLEGVYEASSPNEPEPRTMVERARYVVQAAIQETSSAADRLRAFNYLFVRACIREVVSREYGAREAECYWRAVASGEAR